MKLPNIVVRALAGAVFVGLLVGGILINEYTFAAIFALLIGLMLYEFYSLIQKEAKVPVSKVLNIVGGILLFIGVLFYSSWGNCFGMQALTPYLIPYGIYLLILFVSELYKKKENPIKSLAYSLLGQVYIALPLALVNNLTFVSNGFGSSYIYIYILAVLVFIWVNDTFAYLTGRMFGKHRLFERISPKKSWEGFIGGALFAIGSSWFFYHYLSHMHSLPLWAWMGLAAIVVIFGTWGDLIESMMKRTLGVKDSGNMIPGHGGILDRFDSTILAIPAAVIYLELITIVI